MKMLVINCLCFFFVFLQVLLVFPKEDSQCDAFHLAATRLKYKIYVARSGEAAVQSYLEAHHDIVIIDHRQNKVLDSEQVCRLVSHEPGFFFFLKFK